MIRNEVAKKRGDEIRERLAGDVARRPRPWAALAPELSRYVDEYCFGEIWANPTLDIRARSMCTIAALTVLGRETELRFHIRGGLNLGIRPEEIIEIITQMNIYGGLPVAIGAVRIAKEVFDEVGVSAGSGRG